MPVFWGLTHFTSQNDLHPHSVVKMIEFFED